MKQNNSNTKLERFEIVKIRKALDAKRKNHKVSILAKDLFMDKRPISTLMTVSGNPEEDYK